MNQFLAILGIYLIIGGIHGMFVAVTAFRIGATNGQIVGATAVSILCWPLVLAGSWGGWKL